MNTVGILFLLGRGILKGMGIAHYILLKGYLIMLNEPSIGFLDMKIVDIGISLRLTRKGFWTTMMRDITRTKNVLELGGVWRQKLCSLHEITFQFISQNTVLFLLFNFDKWPVLSKTSNIIAYHRIESLPPYLLGYS